MSSSPQRKQGSPCSRCGLADRAVAMPTFSLIVPTRGRPEQLHRFLTSVETTVARPDDVEVVLVVDADDGSSLEVSADRLRVAHVVVAPGQTMGALNMAGYAASSGRYLM